MQISGKDYYVVLEAEQSNIEKFVDIIEKTGLSKQDLLDTAEAFHSELVWLINCAEHEGKLKS